MIFIADGLTSRWDLAALRTLLERQIATPSPWEWEALQ